MAAINQPKYSDFTTQFLQHPVSGDVARITDFEAIRRSIKNLLLTDKYERLLDPRIGANIRRTLFEPMDGATATVIQNYIRETIVNYEPRARLEDVIVVPDYDNNLYTVTIYFSVRFSEEVQRVDLFLTRIR